MGHYTGFKGKLVLKAELPENYLAVLKYMLWMDGSRDNYDRPLPGFENHLENLLVSIQDEPNTAFFISKYWSSILLGTEPVMFPYSNSMREPGDFVSLEQRPDGRHEVAWASSGKYQWLQLEQFIHWLVPYLDNEGNEEPILIAQSCYEHSNGLFEAFLVGDKVHWSPFVQKREPKEDEPFFGRDESYDEGDVYHAFSETPVMEDHGRDWDKMDEKATILKVDGIEYRKDQWYMTMIQSKYSLRQFRDSRRLVTGIEPIDETLDGGLHMNKTSLWFAPPRNFGQGHLVNMLIDAMINNRPPEGTYYKAALLIGQGNIDSVAVMIYQRLFLHKTGQISNPETIEMAAMRLFVMETVMSLGWKLAVLLPNPGEVTGDAFEDILLHVNDRNLKDLKLVIMDNIHDLGDLSMVPDYNLEKYNETRTKYDFHLAVGASLPGETNRSFRSGEWYGKEIAWLEQVINDDMLDTQLARHADMVFVQRMDEGKVYFATSRIGTVNKSFVVGLTPEFVYEKGSS